MLVLAGAVEVPVLAGAAEPERDLDLDLARARGLEQAGRVALESVWRAARERGGGRGLEPAVLELVWLAERVRVSAKAH
ncbi:hypothetical protein [Arthrobacter tumbae]|uniref:hypothetical protein n=1 Tax=Arthrobacter tumbae TaxID=163874 RepID=UPI00195B05DD|nr:hypothetical protein [Arthrobacter tumbae]MBM7781670.1 hypothetical protein [Arthrobacter tumbae]